MRLVGISGKRGSGKSSLARVLTKQYDYTEVPFAKELKQQVRADFGLTTEHTDGKLKEKPIAYIPKWTPRKIMIEYGRFYRTIDPMFWVKRAFARISDYTAHVDTENFVIPDVRFKNEADYIKSKGGILVRLNRFPHMNCYGPDPLDDLSETDLDKYKGFDLDVKAEANQQLADLVFIGIKINEIFENLTIKPS